MNRKKVFLHIGFFKTGTTALQEFCFNNFAPLFEHGVYYPCNGDHFHGAFFNSLVDGLEVEHPPLHLRNMYRSSGGAVWKNTLHTFYNLPVEKLLISCEWFCDLADQDPGGIAASRLVEHLSDVDDVQVIIYMRNMSKYLSSLYREVVKINDDFNQNYSEFLEYHLENDTIHINPYRVLDYFAELFGKDRLIIKRYDEASLDKNSLYKSFLGVLLANENNRLFRESQLEALSEGSLEKVLLQFDQSGFNTNPSFSWGDIKEVIKLRGGVEVRKSKVNQVLNQVNEVMRQSDSEIEARYGLKLNSDKIELYN